MAKAISAMVQQACIAAAVVLPDGFSDSLAGNIADGKLALGEGGVANSGLGKPNRGKTREADDIEALRNDQVRGGRDGAAMAS